MREGCSGLRDLTHLCPCTAGSPGELSAQLPERLSLVVGSILGALAFLLLAAITVLALVFQR